MNLKVLEGVLLVSYFPSQESSFSISLTNFMLLTHDGLRNIGGTLELSIKYLKEGQDRRFDPSLRKQSIKSLLAHRLLNPLLKIS